MRLARNESCRAGEASGAVQVEAGAPSGLPGAAPGAALESASVVA